MSMNHLREWREARGMSQEALADAIGKSVATVSRYESGDQAIPSTVLPRIEDALRIGRGAIFLPPPPGTDGAHVGSIRDPARPIAPKAPWSPSAGAQVFPDLPRDVPVLGVAAGSVSGAVHLTEGPVDWVRRPPALAGVPDVYAIYIKGDSMEREHRDGDLRFVHPHRPAHVGDTVVVQTRDAAHRPLQTWIKYLKRRSEAAIVLEQSNPPATYEFKAKTVVAVHKVLTMNELFGI